MSTLLRALNDLKSVEGAKALIKKNIQKRSFRNSMNISL